ncbi:hypothetical protein TNCV_4364851 [Trichonephila clavipes]|nr:hypothetical protein TNCV_2871961 [Trichonephila clavipes]GFV38760.1 hypothetical protein TNCV_4364851 [Trichonephila clavipes]
MCWSVWCDNINSRANSPIAKDSTVSIAPPWVPTRMFSIKITKEEGFVIVSENSVQFRDINGAVWMFVDTRHSDFRVVTYLNDNGCVFECVRSTNDGVVLDRILDKDSSAAASVCESVTSVTSVVWNAHSVRRTKMCFLYPDYVGVMKINAFLKLI